jgi:putative redox protein
LKIPDKIGNAAVFCNSCTYGQLLPQNGQEAAPQNRLFFSAFCAFSWKIPAAGGLSPLLLNMVVARCYPVSLRFKRKYMPLMEVTRTQGDFGFTATDAGQHTLQIDIPVEQGGQGNGFRPMQLLLAGLGGCSAMDIVTILKKQKQDLQQLSIKIDGEREPGKEPSLWQQVTLVFEMQGSVEPTKAYKAAQLSMDKYCSVAETLRRAGANLNWTVTLNGETVGAPAGVTQ